MLHGAFVFCAVFGIELAPVADSMPPKERSGGVAGLGERLEGAGGCHNLPQGKRAGVMSPPETPPVWPSP